MSLPTKATTFGSLKIDDQTYPLYSIPLEDEHFKLLREYVNTYKCGKSSAPWKFNKYHWELIENKLYLIEIDFALCPEPKISYIKDIFGKDKVFASWANREIKALVSVIEDKTVNTDKFGQRKIIRDVMILEFKEGILQKRREELETVEMRVLKNYIEE